MGDEELGQSSKQGGGDEERLDWDDDDESIHEAREEEEYSFTQKGKKGSKSSDPASDELERIQLDEELGQSSHKESGGDEERLDWDDDDEAIHEAREEEEYS